MLCVVGGVGGSKYDSFLVAAVVVAAAAAVATVEASKLQAR